MARIFPTALFAGLISACSTNLVGTTVPPYPNGLASKSGSCTGPSLNQLCDFSVGILQSSDGKPVGVLARQSLKRIDDRPSWRVTDHIPWPNLSKQQVLATFDCRIDGKVVRGLIAVVQLPGDGTGYAPARVWARKLDYASGKFTTYSTEGIKCLVST